MLKIINKNKKDVDQLRFVCIDIIQALTSTLQSAPLFLQQEILQSIRTMCWIAEWMHWINEQANTYADYSYAIDEAVAEFQSFNVELKRHVPVTHQHKLRQIESILLKLKEENKQP